MINSLKKSYSFDLRSLALFRILLGSTILFDLILRSRDLVAHYGDLGVLPRHNLLKYSSKLSDISFHLASGSEYWQILLFALAALFSISLVIGYKTKLSTFLCFVFLFSLQIRNPLILNSGDSYLKLLLFWSIFLPLGAKYSLDEALSFNVSEKTKKETEFSLATCAFILQIASLYFFAAVLKKHEVWFNGLALPQAFLIDQFVSPIGKYLTNFPELLKFLSIGSLALEWLGPVFLLFPYGDNKKRLVIMALFISLHLGIMASMNIYLFSLISIIAWVPLLPSQIWNYIERKKLAKQKSIIMYYDPDCGFCLKMCHIIRCFLILIRCEIKPASDDTLAHSLMIEQNSWVLKIENKYLTQSTAIATICLISPFSKLFQPFFLISNSQNRDKVYQFIANNRAFFSKFLPSERKNPAYRKLFKWEQIFLLCCMIYATCWNIRSTNFKLFSPYFPKSINWIGQYLHITQYWSMFTPRPLINDGWLVIPGHLKNGKMVDVFRSGADVSFEKPENLANFHSERWRKYTENIRNKKNKKYRLSFGKYICREWNKTHSDEDKLMKFKIYFMLEKTFELTEREPKKNLIWSHDCFKKSKD